MYESVGRSCTVLVNGVTWSSSKINRVNHRS
jgi:hypothetical protein